MRIVGYKVFVGIKNFPYYFLFDVVFVSNARYRIGCMKSIFYIFFYGLCRNMNKLNNV